eukprot:tig00020553_g10644.t1
MDAAAAWEAANAVWTNKVLPLLAMFGETPGHFLVELIFVTVIIILLLQKSYKPSKQTADLTDKEIDQLVAEWNPEPLYPAAAADAREYTPPVISGAPGPHTTVGDKSVINLAALNFLGIAGDENIEKACADTIQKYGVGSCGPRGFYGTIDVHLDFEQRVASFLGMESAILYSYDLATISSAIPAFAKRGDVIMCDDGVSWAIQSGIQLSRSDVVYFKHNNMDDLEVKIIETEEKLKKKKSPTRRFIVVEGIYQNHGDICPLPKLVELRSKYKYYLVIDESVSFGVLGNTGRAAIEAINKIENNPSLALRLQRNAATLYRHLSRLDNIDVEGDMGSPLLHIRARRRSGNVEEERKTLQAIADLVLKAHNLLVTCAFYSKLDRLKPAPSIRLSVQASHSEKDIADAVHGLSLAVDAVIPR